MKRNTKILGFAAAIALGAVATAALAADLPKVRFTSLDDPLVARALMQREPVQVPDTRDQPSVNEIIQRAGYRALLIAPLMRPDHIVGLLVIRRKEPGQFSKETVDLLKTFAAQSVLAIQNARCSARSTKRADSSRSKASTSRSSSPT